jgi:hypothetical protein
MTDKIEPIEVKEFLSQILSQVEDGVDIEQRNISGPIEVEMSIEKVASKGGEIKAYVVGGGVNTSSNKIARVRFSVYPKQSQRSKNQIEEIIEHNREEAEEWRSL